MDALRGEMLWYDDAPSNVAEDILRKVHRPTILPAPISDSRDLRRFECHLKGNGVGKYFSVAEIVRPNRPDVAAASGWEDLTPPAFCWGLSTLLICLADRMREAAGSPVTLRNYWRPQSYNSMVSSSGIDSDHPNAAGIDLEHDRASRDAGQRVGCELLVLWGERGIVHKLFDPLALWRAQCRGAVSGRLMPCTLTWMCLAWRGS